MLSRVAQNLYWLGRYVERTENVARLLDVAYHLDLDAAALTDSTGGISPMRAVLEVLACTPEFEVSPRTPGGDRERVLNFLTFDRGGTHSILSMLGMARENARASREALSGDSWDQLNTLYLTLKSRKLRTKLEESPLRFLDWVKRGCILFSGLIESSLPRSEAYHFLKLGRHLERVNQIGRILQINVPEPPDPEQTGTPQLGMVRWSNLLRSCSAYEAYLQDHQDHVDPEGVVEFLVLTANFPRAIRFCVLRCCESLEVLSASNGEGYRSEAQRLLGRLESELRFLNVHEIMERDLKSFLVGLLGTCNQIGDEIHQSYFFT